MKTPVAAVIANDDFETARDGVVGGERRLTDEKAQSAGRDENGSCPHGYPVADPVDILLM